MIENIIYVTIQILFVLVPWCFISYKKGNNKLIFVASVVGLVTIVQMLLMGLFGGIFYLLEFIVPLIFPDGAPEFTYPILNALEWYRENWIFVVLGAIFIGFFTFQLWLYKKCEIFQTG